MHIKQFEAGAFIISRISAKRREEKRKIRRRNQKNLNDKKKNPHHLSVHRSGGTRAHPGRGKKLNQVSLVDLLMREPN